MKKTTAEQRALSKAYKNVFLGSSTAQEGQLVLTDLINQCNIFKVNLKSAEEALILEAKKSIGIYLFAQVGLTAEYGGEVDLMQLGNITQVLASTDAYMRTIHQPKEGEQDV